jgi:hypothetical protein
MHTCRSIGTILLAVMSVGAAAQSPRPTGPASDQKSHAETEKESFIHRLLRISGIAAAPSTLKGPGDDLKTGQIWVADVINETKRMLTTKGAYRSPVFMPASDDVIALQGTAVVRVSPSGEVKKLYSIADITKLVGFSLDHPDELLMLRRDSTGQTRVELLILRSGKRIAVEFDPASNDDRSMVEHLQSWDRSYGDKTIYVKRESKSEVFGKIEWTDVYFKDGRRGAVNASRCDGVNCGQPSLSADGRKLVFVMEE